MNESPIRVLLIEDDKDDYQLTSALLGELGNGHFILEWASTYDAGLQAMRLNTHDVCLVDHRLNGRNGVDLLREAYKSGCQTPVILLSEQGGHTPDVEAMRAGASDFLIKGQFTASLLERSIRYALERQQADVATRQGEERFKTAFEQSAIGMCMVSLEGRFLQVNEAACKLFGYRLEEMLRLTMTEVSADADSDVEGAAADGAANGAANAPTLNAPARDGAEQDGAEQHEAEQMRRLLAGEIESFQFEHTYRHRQGHTFCGLSGVSLVRDLGGRPLYLIVQVQDISARKQAEDALRVSEARFRTVVESLGEGVLITDPDDVIRYTNARLAVLSGYTPDEMLGQPAYELLLRPEDWPALRERNRRRASGISETYRVQLRRKDGSLFWAEINATPYVDATGEITGTLGAITDITERKAAEERQRATTERLRAVLEAADELLACPDLDTVLRRAVEMARERLGLERCAIFLVDEQNQEVTGTYGTNLRGETTGEHAMGMRKTDWLGWKKPLLPSGPRWTLHRDVPLYEWDEELGVGRRIGQGWNAVTPILSSHGPVGMLCNDSAISGAPPDEAKQEMTAVWCSLLGNIIERRQATDALRESEERYALAARGANDGLWDWDFVTDRIYFSPRWKSMLGYEEKEIGDSPNEPLRLMHPDDVVRVRAALTAHVEGATPHFESEHRMRHKDGTYRWMLSRGLAVRDAEGRCLRMAGSQTDITERKAAEEQLLRNAFFDELTGLPNRALFTDRLKSVMGHMKRRTGYGFAVLFLDLDHFKVVNDSLGHMAGDQLLKIVAQRLETCLRPGDAVARLGGDEFTLLLDDIDGPDTATRIAERIQQELSSPIRLSGHEMFMPASIGIALGAPSYEQPEEILRDADTAMYRAKAQGRARYEVFDEAMHVQAMARLQLEGELRRAIGDQMALHYQPIVRLDSGAICGFEALVRWQHPERGLVPPSVFVPLAEETGLIFPLSRWVLRKACLQMRAWAEQFLDRPELTMGVNLSSKQFSQPDLGNEIEETLRETGLEARRLKLEITESVIMENAVTVTTTLRQLKSLDISLSMDDFGTGYSSLSYLHNFPIDVLKVDRSFISRIGPQGDHSEIVRAIMTLAHTLNLRVVAEGVETAEQMEHLKTLGCEYGQGYFFSRPVEAAAAAELIIQKPRW